MTWAGFWVPNLITWIVGAALTAIVGAVVGFVIRWWARRYLGEWLTQIFGEQQATKALASTAATAAVAAQEHARAADVQSQTAVSNTAGEQTERALLYLAEQLGDTVAAVKRMAREKDDLFAALLHAQALLEEQQRRMEQYLAGRTARYTEKQEDSG